MIAPRILSNTVATVEEGEVWAVFVLPGCKIVDVCGENVSTRIFALVRLSHS